MREVRHGLWHWQARHPGWEPGEPWDANVSSDAIADEERRLLFDPLGVPSEIEALAAESQRAVISGDTLVDFGQGLEINERWLPRV